MLDLGPTKEWLDRFTSDEFRSGRHLLSTPDGELDRFICTDVYALVAEVERLDAELRLVRQFVEDVYGVKIGGREAAEFVLRMPGEGV